MSMDRSYFMRRAAQERSAAAHASGDKARDAHREMAKRYRALVNVPETGAREEPKATA